MVCTEKKQNKLEKIGRKDNQIKNNRGQLKSRNCESNKTLQERKAQRENMRKNERKGEAYRR